jgi:hypothetical protein
MKTISTEIKKASQAQNLERYSQISLPKNEDGTHEISVYTPQQLTPEGLAKATELIVSAFPRLGKGFYKILLERAEAIKFSDQRLLDAVNHVIDNCEYPEPTIAQFMTFDKRVKLYTHPEILKMNDQMHGGVFKHYSSVRIDGHENPFWASNQDINKYKLTPFNQDK